MRSQILIATVFAATCLAQDLSVVPDLRLTPGAVLTTDEAEVCSTGYARSHREWLPISAMREVDARYGYRYQPGQVEIDHKIFRAGSPLLERWEECAAPFL